MKQQAIHFVGLDVHQSTTVASVRDESGSVVMSATVPTTEKTIVALLRSRPRRVDNFTGELGRVRDLSQAGFPTVASACAPLQKMASVIQEHALGTAGEKHQRQRRCESP